MRRQLNDLSDRLHADTMAANAAREAGHISDLEWAEKLRNLIQEWHTQRDIILKSYDEAGK
jgi:flagellum-specific peptidoglycan hydrolase FlgJ